jgi:hypothetical protein
MSSSNLQPWTEYFREVLKNTDSMESHYDDQTDLCNNFPRIWAETPSQAEVIKAFTYSLKSGNRLAWTTADTMSRMNKLQTTRKMVPL